MDQQAQKTDGQITEYVTAMIGGQLFGLPISRVQDVFMPERLTRVPLASDDIAGVLNLRGRIVTACTVSLAPGSAFHGADCAQALAKSRSAGPVKAPAAASAVPP